MKRKKTKLVYKRIALAVALVSLISVCIIGVRAWLYNSQGLKTVTQVSNPTTLTIMGQEKTAIQQIDLSQIDLTKDSFDFVFCVVSDTATPYQIELAHTTNIPFTYTMYNASRVGVGEYSVGEYVINYTGEASDIDINRKVGYINLDTESNIANQSQHANTYNTYDNVQKNAEPLYWLSDNMQPVKDSDNEYVNYYVLRLDWDKTVVNDAKYTKETDLVYLMAEN